MWFLKTRCEKWDMFLIFQIYFVFLEYMIIVIFRTWKTELLDNGIYLFFPGLLYLIIDFSNDNKKVFGSRSLSYEIWSCFVLGVRVWFLIKKKKKKVKFVVPYNWMLLTPPNYSLQRLLVFCLPSYAYNGTYYFVVYIFFIDIKSINFCLVQIRRNITQIKMIRNQRKIV